MTNDNTPPLTPALLLQAYAAGVFPMSESRDDPEVFWVDPSQRGVIELNRFHISRSLAKRLRNAPFKVSFDTDFEGVVKGCANRDETWINDTIFDLYVALFEKGYAHSVEVWDEAELVGGVYGVTIGAAFFGESMFSTRTDASKIALAYLVDRLNAGGYQLFDTQFITSHLASLGAVEIPRDTYQSRLEIALEKPADFNRISGVPAPYDLIQRNAHTS